MDKIFPKKLQPGDGVRVIAPASSLALPWITENLVGKATERFNQLGLKLSFAKHVYEIDEFHSSSIESRLEDIHDAFKDPSIQLIITVIGGSNTNQLLQYLDYDLIKANPKILCGYSDITALQNAITRKTGLVTYSGPHFFSFGEDKGFEYTFEYFKRCVMRDAPFDVSCSSNWSNDRWAKDQDHRNFIKNEGYWVINEGITEGTILGGNQCTLNLLQGTEFMPDLSGSVLFLEDDYLADFSTIDRDLQSLIHQSGFRDVRGIVFGRFEQKSGVTLELLKKIVKTKKELDHIPILANVDFGHTTPAITFPIGGHVSLQVGLSQSIIKIQKH